MSSATRSSHATPRSRTPGRDSSPSTTPTGGIAPSWNPVTPSPVLKVWPVTTQLSLPRSSSTVTIVSPNAKVVTSTWYSHTSTTPTSQLLVSTSTPSPSSQKNISHQAAATSLVLITPHSSSLSPTTLSIHTTQPRSASTPSTTTFSVSCPVWVVSPTPTKRLGLYLYAYKYGTTFGCGKSKNAVYKKFSTTDVLIVLQLKKFLFSKKRTRKNSIISKIRRI